MILVRQAVLDDAKTVFLWRNDIRVRQNFFCKDELKYEDHFSWFKCSLEMPTRHLLIMQFDNKPVGVIRFDVTSTTAEVDIYVDPLIAGSGYGTEGLQAGLSWLKESCPEVNYVEAKVLPNNIASQKLFTKVGFKLSCYFYQLPLN